MPRVGFPGGPRLEWYDRNPSNESIDYFDNLVAPHGQTIRASYTVPSGKKAFVGAVTIEVYRDGAATTVGQVMAWVGWTLMLSLTVSMRDNAVGARVSSEVFLGSVLLAGTVIDLRTFDLSAGGTMQYTLSAVIMEFDA